MLRSETRLRARATQLLYAWQIQGRPALRQTTGGLLAGHPRCRRAIERSEDLVARVVPVVDDLDRDIASAVEHWRYERVGLVERTILRLALYELQYGKTPPKVVINEAVRLAHWFAGESAPRFINGVLDAVARRAGSL